MGVIQDYDNGVLDRFLVLPTKRTALVIGRLAVTVVTTLIQAVILVALAIVAGADFEGGLPGIAILLAAAVLLAIPFAALSNAMAVLVRQEESVIGAVQFVQLPLSFLSSVFMATALMPDWMQTVAQYNPVDWAAVAGRAALEAAPDWSLIVPRLAWLAIFGLISIALAVRAFRSYQRAI